MSESSLQTAREHTSLADSKQDVPAVFVKETVTCLAGKAHMSHKNDLSTNTVNNSVEDLLNDAASLCY
jgi:hypothetical protein|tara:strand:+ start:249 stop:452 length:204 start_codon:yes stop_codon:yes gene_type:complete